MNFLNNRIVSRIVSIGILGIGLAGCASMQGVDLLTWSNDAKRQGIQQYNDGRYAEAAGCFRNAIRQNPIDPESRILAGDELRTDSVVP